MIRTCDSCGGNCWNVCQTKPSPNVSAADTDLRNDSRYLKLAGGTLTGPLLLSGGPTASLQAATKDYVDSHVTSVLQLRASVADFASLPMSGNQNGDVRQTSDTNDLYLYDGTQWSPMGKASTPIPTGDSTTDGYMLFWDAPHAQWQVGPQPIPAGDATTDGYMLFWDASHTQWQVGAQPTPSGDATTDGYMLFWDAPNAQWQVRPHPDSLALVVGTWSDLPATASDGRIAYVQDNDVLAVFDPALSGWMKVGQPQRFASPAALPSYYTEPGMLAYSDSDKTVYVQVPGALPGSMVWQPIDDVVRKQVASLATGVQHGESVVSVVSAPPVTPITGQPYIVLSPATGAWLSHDNALATWDGAAWSYIAPVSGESHMSEADGSIWHFNGSGWVKISNAITKLVSSDAGNRATTGTDGAVFVAAATLNDLSDVASAGATDGFALVYDAVSGQWQPKQMTNQFPIVVLTKAAYNALAVKDPNTIYCIKA